MSENSSTLPPCINSSAINCSSDALFEKCNRAASASLLIRNESYLRKVFNRHADHEPPLALSAKALDLALQSIRAVCARDSASLVSAIANSGEADNSLKTTMQLEEFKSAALQRGGNSDLDIETIFLQYADVGGQLSFEALMNALKEVNLALLSEDNSSTDHRLIRAGAPQSDVFNFVRCNRHSLCNNCVLARE
jgi:hypothetical protein